MIFKNRSDAGQRLAIALARYAPEHPLVLALPRGGVPVAYEVARALDAPLDVFIARKLGAPLQPEFAIGAVAEGGVVIVDPTADEVGLDAQRLARAIAREQAEIATRVERFRGGRPLGEVRGRMVIVIDDGIATGATARASLRALRAMGPARLVLAVPVAAADSVATLRGEVDELVCLEAPVDFAAVGYWYEDFEQVSDDEVIALLRRATR